jgi:hypothetical protein
MDYDLEHPTHDQNNFSHQYIHANFYFGCKHKIMNHNCPLKPLFFQEYSWHLLEKCPYIFSSVFKTIMLNFILKICPKQSRHVLKFTKNS